MKRAEFLVNAAVVRVSCIAIVVVLGGCRGSSESASAPRATLTASPGSTYDSLQTLPDWSGAWGTKVRPDAVSVLMQEPSPLQPQPHGQMATLVKKWATGRDPGAPLSDYCRPYAFGGFSEGFEGFIEFMFTPGRVTLLWEGGLTRRIYTDGRKLPEAVEESDAGTSVGHWEGQILVVDTVGMHPRAYAFGIRPGPKIGRNAKTTERIHLMDDDTLEIDTVLEAPDLLIRPVSFATLYQRYRSHVMGEYTTCADSDRSIDPTTGHQRFDMTPPKDLPPPPAL